MANKGCLDLMFSEKFFFKGKNNRYMIDS